MYTKVELYGTAGQKVQGGGVCRKKWKPGSSKNMTHPLVVAQNFGDPPRHWAEKEHDLSP